MFLLWCLLDVCFLLDWVLKNFKLSHALFVSVFVYVEVGRLVDGWVLTHGSRFHVTHIRTYKVYIQSDEVNGLL